VRLGRFAARSKHSFAVHVISALEGQITPTEVVISMAAEIKDYGDSLLNPFWREVGTR
jgi:hypothetical protein